MEDNCPHLDCLVNHHGNPCDCEMEKWCKECKDNWEKEFDKELDSWLKSDKHKSNCASWNEDLFCCLDRYVKQNIYGADGRGFVKAFIQKEKDKSFNEALDLAIGEEKVYDWENLETLTNVDVHNIEGYNEKRQEIIELKKRHE